MIRFNPPNFTADDFNSTFEEGKFELKNIRRAVRMEETEESELKLAFCDGVVRFHTWGTFTDKNGNDFPVALVSICAGIFSHNTLYEKIEHLIVGCVGNSEEERLEKEEDFKKDVRSILKDSCKILKVLTTWSNQDRTNAVRIAVLERMRELEIELALSWASDNIKDDLTFVVVDGVIQTNFAHRITKKLGNKSTNFVANVKTSQVKFDKVDELTIFERENFSGDISKFFFFVRVWYKELPHTSNLAPFLRFEFVSQKPNIEKISKVFSPFLKQIKKNVSLVGSRTPQNLVPIRTLENALRMRLPDSQIFVRKVLPAF